MRPRAWQSKAKVRMERKMQPTKRPLWPIAHFQAQVPPFQNSFLSFLDSPWCKAPSENPLCTVNPEDRAPGPTCWAGHRPVQSWLCSAPGPVLRLRKTSWLLLLHICSNNWGTKIRVDTNIKNEEFLSLCLWSAGRKTQGAPRPMSYKTTSLPSPHLQRTRTSEAPGVQESG